MIAGIAHNPFFSRLSAAVVAGHLLLIWLICTQVFNAPAVQPKPRLVVQSVPLKPTKAPPFTPPAPMPEAPPLPPEPVQPEPPAPAPEPVAKPEPVVQEEPAPPKAAPKAKSPKEQPAKKTKKKTPPPKKSSPEPKSNAKKISSDKLAQARANLNKVSHSSTPLASVAAVDKGNDIGSTPEQRYEEALATRLKSLLTLPDYGDVRVKVTLNREGHVQSVQVINAKSEENRAYVAKILPTVKFPPFGNYFSSQSSHTFQLVLSND